MSPLTETVCARQHHRSVQSNETLNVRQCSTTGTARLSPEVQFGSKGAGNRLDDLSFPCCLGQKAVKRLQRLLWAGFCIETIYFCRVSAVVSVLLFLLKPVSKGLHCCRGYFLSDLWIRRKTDGPDDGLDGSFRSQNPQQALEGVRSTACRLGAELQRCREDNSNVTE